MSKHCWVRRSREVGGVTSRKRKENCEGSEVRWSFATSRNRKKAGIAGVQGTQWCRDEVRAMHKGPDHAGSCVDMERVWDLLPRAMGSY